jgi:hypothetical protein
MTEIPLRDPPPTAPRRRLGPMADALAPHAVSPQNFMHEAYDVFESRLAGLLTVQARAPVSQTRCFLAWNGSPCLRHGGHGASIGGGGGTPVMHARHHGGSSTRHMIHPSGVPVAGVKN